MITWTTVGITIIMNWA